MIAVLERKLNTINAALTSEVIESEFLRDNYICINKFCTSSHSVIVFNCISTNCIFIFPLQVGYHIYPAELGPLRHAVRSAASHTYTSIPAPIQYAITDVSFRTLLHPSMNFTILTR